MGWYQTPGSTLRGMIAELSKDKKSENPNRVIKTVCIAKCFRGARTHKGILWAVWERTIYSRPTMQVMKVDRYITCDLMEYWRHSRGQSNPGWAYKPMGEECHPYYYNCPEKYLKMVPEIQCQEWRDEVVKYHINRRTKLAKKKLALV